MVWGMRFRPPAPVTTGAACALEHLLSKLSNYFFEGYSRWGQERGACGTGSETPMEQGRPPRTFQNFRDQVPKCTKARRRWSRVDRGVHFKVSEPKCPSAQQKAATPMECRGGRDTASRLGLIAGIGHAGYPYLCDGDGQWHNQGYAGLRAHGAPVYPCTRSRRTTLPPARQGRKGRK